MVCLLKNLSSYYTALFPFISQLFVLFCFLQEDRECEVHGESPVVGEASDVDDRHGDGDDDDEGREDVGDQEQRAHEHNHHRDYHVSDKQTKNMKKIY